MAASVSASSLYDFIDGLDSYTNTEVDINNDYTLMRDNDVEDKIYRIRPLVMLEGTVRTLAGTAAYQGTPEASDKMIFMDGSSYFFRFATISTFQSLFLSETTLSTLWNHSDITTDTTPNPSRSLLHHGGGATDIEKTTITNLVAAGIFNAATTTTAPATTDHVLMTVASGEDTIFRRVLLSSLPSSGGGLTESYIDGLTAETGLNALATDDYIPFLDESESEIRKATAKTIVFDGIADQTTVTQPDDTVNWFMPLIYPFTTPARTSGKISMGNFRKWILGSPAEEDDGTHVADSDHIVGLDGGVPHRYTVGALKTVFGGSGGSSINLGSITTNILPSTDGRNLGSSSKRWDLFAEEVDIDGDMEIDGDIEIGGELNHDGDKMGFYGASPVSQAAWNEVSNLYQTGQRNGMTTATLNFLPDSVVRDFLRIFAGAFNLLVSDLQRMGVFSAE